LNFRLKTPDPHARLAFGDFRLPRDKSKFIFDVKDIFRVAPKKQNGELGLKKGGARCPRKD
jgi:hypothetical protein